MSFTRRCLVVMIAALVLVAPACGADPPSRVIAEGSGAEGTDPAGTEQTADRAAVLAAAAHELVTKDNGFGQGPDPFVAIDVVERFSDDARPSAEALSGELLDETARDAIAAAFAPRPITWVSRQFDPALGLGTMASGAAREPLRGIVLLAVPEIDGDAAKVAVSLGCGRGCFTGGTYALRKNNGAWSVTGKPGGWWIT
jgi:hypothetical protein